VASDFSLRIHANGAARGDMGEMMKLVEKGDFKSVAEVVSFISRQQRMTLELFERVCVAWDLDVTSKQIAALEESPLRDVPKP
jgi:hypothetical protein